MLASVPTRGIPGAVLALQKVKHTSVSERAQRRLSAISSIIQTTFNNDVPGKRRKSLGKIYSFPDSLLCHWQHSFRYFTWGTNITVSSCCTESLFLQGLTKRNWRWRFLSWSHKDLSPSTDQVTYRGFKIILTYFPTFTFNWQFTFLPDSRQLTWKSFGSSSDRNLGKQK